MADDYDGIRDYLVERLTASFVGDTLDSSEDFIVKSRTHPREAIYYDADGGGFYLITIEPARIAVGGQGPG